MFDGGFVLSGEAAEPCGDFAVGQLVQARHVAVSTESRDAVWVASCVGGKLCVASCVCGKLCLWEVCAPLVWPLVPPPQMAGYLGRECRWRQHATA